jgi:pimeloyl-ACP methyl ester carboxylesterase
VVLVLAIAAPARAVETASGMRFGITMITDGNDRTPMEQYRAVHGAMPDRVVVLVHGLDDPGWMWRDVIPALRDAGHVVARMRYPNDGPIRASADLFAAHLRALRRAGVERVDVVAHSMGGLVTRDVLTRSIHFDGDARGVIDGVAVLPHVDRFIMCGTPNHGSHLARLRAVSEVKEHLTRTFSGEGAPWLGSLADGDGEAAIDLLPGSRFLTDLNARPLARHVCHTIIAGRMSPVGAREVDELADTIREAASAAKAPRWLRNWIDSAGNGAGNAFDEVVRGLGDGCVTIDSARLKGVDDFVVVEANHVSMIVAMVADADDDPPPAVPLILERLAAPPE